MGDHVSHELLEDEAVEKRLYQLNIASTALEQSTLVILPTGLGKTVVALLVTASRMTRAGGPVLMVAPTKPLVEQHARFFSENSQADTEILTGETRPDDREEIWNRGDAVFFSTPQVVENDVVTGRIDLSSFSLLIFDEAHRASGDYPYSWIASRYVESSDDPLSMGLTASPGNGPEDVKRICDSLHLHALEVRSDESPDVEPYVHRREVEWEEVELPESLEEVSDNLLDILEDRMEEVEDLGLAPNSSRKASRKDLLDVQKRVQGRIASNDNPSGELFRAASLVAEAVKVRHGVDVLETQGPAPARKYLERLRNEGRNGGSKAAQRLAEDIRFKKGLRALKKHDGGFPKTETLKEVLNRDLNGSGESKAIVFTNYRDTASTLVEELEEMEGVRPVRFVGQASKNGDKGLNQDEQAEVLRKFEDGRFNVLVGTSVAEEGLDIPSTDLVVFYEPVASAIRSVQRKGRTGRAREGRILVLITKGTRDEGVYWASKRREDKMKDSVKDLAQSGDIQINDSPKGQASLSKFDGDEKGASGVDVGEKEERIEIAVDHREGKSGVLRRLHGDNVDIETAQLDVADFVIGERVGVERKSVDDFLSSMLDGEGRLFEQASKLVESFERPVVLLEGENLYGERNVHPNAVRGAISSLVLDFGVSLVRTSDLDETAALIESMAKREASQGRRKPHLHDGKTSDTLADQQVRLVSSIKGVGTDTAEQLLEHFGSVSSLVEAGVEELTEVEGVGEDRAKSIEQVLHGRYGE